MGIVKGLYKIYRLWLLTQKIPILNIPLKLLPLLRCPPTDDLTWRCSKSLSSVVLSHTCKQRPEVGEWWMGHHRWELHGEFSFSGVLVPTVGDFSKTRYPFTLRSYRGSGSEKRSTGSYKDRSWNEQIILDLLNYEKTKWCSRMDIPSKCIVGASNTAA